MDSSRKLSICSSRNTKESQSSWIIVNPKWKNSSIFEGRKIVTIPDLVKLEFTEQENSAYESRCAAAADKIICFSSLSLQQIAQNYLIYDSRKIRVVPHAPIRPLDFRHAVKMMERNKLRLFSSEQTAIIVISLLKELVGF